MTIYKFQLSLALRMAFFTAILLATLVKPFSSRLNVWEEIFGKLNHLEEKDGSCYAEIGKIHVDFPLEMLPRLKEHRGKQIGIIRCDDRYRIRVIE